MKKVWLIPLVICIGCNLTEQAIATAVPILVTTILALLGITGG